MNIIIWSGDILRFIQAMSSDVNEMKERLGDAAEKQDASVIV